MNENNNNNDLMISNDEYEIADLAKIQYNELKAFVEFFNRLDIKQNFDEETLKLLEIGRFILYLRMFITESDSINECIRSLTKSQQWYEFEHTLNQTKSLQPWFPKHTHEEVKHFIFYKEYIDSVWNLLKEMQKTSIRDVNGFIEINEANISSMGIRIANMTDLMEYQQQMNTTSNNNNNKSNQVPSVVIEKIKRLIISSKHILLIRILSYEKNYSRLNAMLHSEIPLENSIPNFFPSSVTAEIQALRRMIGKIFWKAIMEDIYSGLTEENILEATKKIDIAMKNLKPESFAEALELAEKCGMSRHPDPEVQKKIF